MVSTTHHFETALIRYFSSIVLMVQIKNTNTGSHRTTHLRYGLYTVYWYGTRSNYNRMVLMLFVSTYFCNTTCYYYCIR